MTGATDRGGGAPQRPDLGRWIDHGRRARNACSAAAGGLSGRTARWAEIPLSVSRRQPADVRPVHRPRPSIPAPPRQRGGRCWPPGSPWAARRSSRPVRPRPFRCPRSRRPTWSGWPRVPTVTTSEPSRRRSTGSGSASSTASTATSARPPRRRSRRSSATRASASPGSSTRRRRPGPRLLPRARRPRRRRRRAAPSGGGSAVLAVGSSGASVQQLQQLLINAGQNVGGGIDGIYGQMTANAVKRFQQAKGLPCDRHGGRRHPAGPAVRRRRGRPLRRPARSPRVLGAPRSRRSNRRSSPRASASPAGPTASSVPPRPTRSSSSSRPRDCWPPGWSTPRRWPPLGPGARRRLLHRPNPPPRHGRGTGLQQGARGPAVVALQKALISMGWTLVGGADGVFGANTRAVLLRAQRANGVPASGVVDDATARLLNLVSTHRRPPTPPPPRSRPLAARRLPASLPMTSAAPAPSPSNGRSSPPASRCAAAPTASSGPARPAPSWRSRRRPACP